MSKIYRSFLVLALVTFGYAAHADTTGSFQQQEAQGAVAPSDSLGGSALAAQIGDLKHIAELAANSAPAPFDPPAASHERNPSLDKTNSMASLTSPTQPGAADAALPDAPSEPGTH